MSRANGRGELADYAGMLERMLRGYAKAAMQSSDPEDLRRLFDLVEDANSTLGVVVRHAHGEGRLSWQRIGETVGTTGEAARQRWKGDEHLPMTPAVYALLDRRSGVVRYVGKSIQPAVRIATYRRGIAHSTALRDWIRDQEREFQVVILQEVLTGPRDLAAAELAHITEHEETLLNVVGVRSSKRGVGTKQCQSTEIRPVVGRRVPPTEVRCTREIDHEGQCSRNGIEFGREWGRTAWDVYQERLAKRVG